jgi:hypothetical protein
MPLALAGNDLFSSSLSGATGSIRSAASISVTRGGFRFIGTLPGYSHHPSRLQSARKKSLLSVSLPL